MTQHDNKDTSIPLSGALLLALMSLFFGGNFVSIKFSNAYIPPLLAAGLRSVFASILLWMYARTKGEPVFFPSRDRAHEIALGCLFGFDFLFLYWGPLYTDASRAVIFLYTYPLWTALMAHFVLPEDRLTWTKFAGLLLAFMGLVSVFGARSSTLGPLYWVGDLMEVAASLFWAITTVYIKRVISKKPVTHIQTLFVQLFWSVPILLIAAAVFERGRPVVLTPIALAAFSYQVLVVAFFSYLLWFWMVYKYQVSRLAAFVFLTPLFGVLLSGLILGESLSPRLLLGLALVATGIYLVNKPDSRAPNARTVPAGS